MSCQIPREFSVSIKIDQRSEIDRSDEKLAEAIAATRRVIFLLENIRFVTFRPNETALKDLVKTIDDSRVPSDDFRRQTSTLLGDLEGAEVVSGEELGIVQNIIEQLETARSLSQQVDDLITAEKDGW